MLKILSAGVFTFEDVKSLIQHNLVTELEKVKANIIAKRLVVHTFQKIQTKIFNS